MYIITIILAILSVVVLYKLWANSDMFQLKCIISSVDSNTYCVRDREKLHDAADLLAKITDRMNKLVDHVKTNHKEEAHVKRLVDGFNPSRIVETLPTSEHTAYSENKGEKIAFCLDKYKGDNKMIDENTLFFVAMHEMAHVATVSIGHTEEFWRNFKDLIEKAVDAGLYEPIDYSKNPAPYCGMTLTDNPYYRK